ncbi:MAG TPA: response regulator transcription factor [Acidimicrobiales bacterium]|nr:response regulator transcription factor [Acidimicrobiales bacterium]
MHGVLVADDQADMRLLVGAVLEHAHGELAVVGEATTGAEALDQWREIHPEVVLLDQQLPDQTGLEVAEAILHEQPDQRIFLFTADLDSVIRDEAERLGVVAVSKADIFKLPETLSAEWTA